MKTLHFRNQEFQAEIVIKGEDYIKGVNLEGFQVFLFNGISDFSYFTLSPGEEWDLPIEPEKINATNVKLDPIAGITAETVHQGIEKLVSTIKSSVKTVNSIVPDGQGNVNIPNATPNQKGIVSLDGRTISTNSNGDIEATVPNYFEFDYGVTSYVPLAFEGYAGDTVDGSLFQVYIGNEEMRKRIVDMNISIIPLGDANGKAHRVNMDVSWEKEEDGSFINLYYTTENSQFSRDELGVYLYKNNTDYYLTIDIRKADTFNGTSTAIGMVNRTTIRGTQDIIATYEDIESFDVDVVLASEAVGAEVDTFVNDYNKPENGQIGQFTTTIDNVTNSPFKYYVPSIVINSDDYIELYYNGINLEKDTEWVLEAVQADGDLMIRLFVDQNSDDLYNKVRGTVYRGFSKLV